MNATFRNRKVLPLNTPETPGDKKLLQITLLVEVSLLAAFPSSQSMMLSHPTPPP